MGVARRGAWGTKAGAAERPAPGGGGGVHRAPRLAAALGAGVACGVACGVTAARATGGVGQGPTAEGLAAEHRVTALREGRAWHREVAVAEAKRGREETWLGEDKALPWLLFQGSATIVAWPF